MHKTRIITAITVVLGVVSLACLAGYFLALHDIFQDYASPKVLRDHAGVAPESLPRWTTCDLEWGVIYLGFLPMALFHALVFVSRFWRTGNTPNKAMHATAAAPGSRPIYETGTS